MHTAIEDNGYNLSEEEKNKWRCGSLLRFLLFGDKFDAAALLFHLSKKKKRKKKFLCGMQHDRRERDVTDRYRWQEALNSEIWS